MKKIILALTLFGCGSVGRAVASDARGPQFKSSLRQTFISDIFFANKCARSFNNSTSHREQGRLYTFGLHGLDIYLFTVNFEKEAGNGTLKTIFGKNGKQTFCATVFNKWAIPTFFSIFFIFFQQTLHILQQIDVKIFHPVIGAGIQTPDLQNVSLLP